MGFLHIENRSTIRLDTSDLESITQMVLSDCGQGMEYDIGLIMVESGEMRQLNRRYRGHDATTDVLTFGSELSEVCGDSADNVLMGDIIIDINQIEKQRGSNSIKDELIKVFVHGLLHLLGYDHLRSQDKEVMENTEERYLTLIKGTSDGQQ